jgi:H+/Cl- antiporter ClcA
MMISGAAAGLAAVFRAPLTGLVFALEVPFRDDLVHEALLPSLISSVVAYSTLVAILSPSRYLLSTEHYNSATSIWHGPPCWD